MAAIAFLDPLGHQLIVNGRTTLMNAIALGRAVQIIARLTELPEQDVNANLFRYASDSIDSVSDEEIVRLLKEALENGAFDL